MIDKIVNWTISIVWMTLLYCWLWSDEDDEDGSEDSWSDMENEEADSDDEDRDLLYALFGLTKSFLLYFIY